MQSSQLFCTSSKNYLTWPDQDKKVIRILGREFIDPERLRKYIHFGAFPAKIKLLSTLEINELESFLRNLHTRVCKNLRNFIRSILDYFRNVRIFITLCELSIATTRNWFERCIKSGLKFIFKFIKNNFNAMYNNHTLLIKIFIDVYRLNKIYIDRELIVIW